MWEVKNGKVVSQPSVMLVISVPLARLRRRWEDNIRMDLQEVGWACVDWIGLAQDRDRWLALVNAVMKFRVP
jgi:hypothetical protein